MIAVWQYASHISLYQLKRCLPSERQGFDTPPVAPCTFWWRGFFSVVVLNSRASSGTNQGKVRANQPQLTPARDYERKRKSTSSETRFVSDNQAVLVSQTPEAVTPRSVTLTNPYRGFSANTRAQESLSIITIHVASTRKAFDFFAALSETKRQHLACKVSSKAGTDLSSNVQPKRGFTFGELVPPMMGRGCFLLLLLCSPLKYHPPFGAARLPRIITINDSSAGHV